VQTAEQDHLPLAQDTEVDVLACPLVEDSHQRDKSSMERPRDRLVDPSTQVVQSRTQAIAPLDTLDQAVALQRGEQSEHRRLG
jgi:hypothetical protein